MGPTGGKRQPLRPLDGRWAVSTASTVGARKALQVNLRRWLNFVQSKKTLSGGRRSQPRLKLPGESVFTHRLPAEWRMPRSELIAWVATPFRYFPRALGSGSPTRWVGDSAKS